MNQICSGHHFIYFTSSKHDKITAFSLLPSGLFSEKRRELHIHPSIILEKAVLQSPTVNPPQKN